MHETHDTIRLWSTLFRGLRLRCPRCGKGKIFESFFRLRPRCESCDLDITSRSADTWAPIYLSTAGLTGLVIVGMLVLRPANVVIGRLTLATAATTAIVLTLPSRKGAAVALNYFIEVRTGIGAPGNDPT